MDFFSAYATDPKAELEGREFDWGGGVTLLIARSQNSKYTRLLAKSYEAHKHILDQRDTPEQQEAAEKCSNKIMVDVMSKSILLGWTGPVSFQGQDLAYSIDNAAKLLTMKEFRREVEKKADDFRNFRAQSEDDDAKNSSTTSGGNSPGVDSSNT